MTAARYYRKVIRITAEDSPNVRFARAQIRKGITPTNEIVVPGVLPWADFCERLEKWDEVRKSIGLYAEFYEGAELLLYPPVWLNDAEVLEVRLQRDKKLRQAKCIGIDPAEGSDKTAIAIVDEYGLMELVSWHTRDTQQIIYRLIALARKYKVPSKNWVMDRGGGGTQLSNQLQAMGYRCKTVGFGESVHNEPTKRMLTIKERVDDEAERYAYVNRRAEMYGILRGLLDPTVQRDPQGFALPGKFVELRRQLSLMPLLYDKEGRMRMLPKRRTSKAPKKANQSEPTLIEILGCSPDEADALVLACYGLMSKSRRVKVGAF